MAQLDPDIFEYLAGLQKELSSLNDHDPIHKCPADLSLLLTEPRPLLDLADQKLHVFPFSAVEPCWRRLFTDASISLAIHIFGEPDVTEIVRLLDMAILMAGAPLREQMIADLFLRLEPRIPAITGASSFAIAPFRSPSIAFPILRDTFSVPRFVKHFGRPIILLSAIDLWPALSFRPWNPDRLLRLTLSGRRLVPVELGRSYTDADWGQKIMPFGQFLEYLEGRADRIGYLAQHDIFAQIPALRDDICIPDFCYTDPPAGEAKKLEDPLLNMWLGPAGTISPLHTDPYHNLLCQVVGWKYVRLYAPTEGSRMHPRGMEDGVDMQNTSRVPVERVEMGILEDDEFEDFEDASYVEAILGPSEVLYIPPGWWHYVRALSISISVSFWWN